MTRDKITILSEIDALYALGNYIKRRNTILGASPISAATEVIAARIAILYNEFLQGLADNYDLASNVRAIVHENRYMIYDIVDLVKEGVLDFDMVEPMIDFLVSDTETKAAILEGAY